jgi:hypothetical protein
MQACGLGSISAGMGSWRTAATVPWTGWPVRISATESRPAIAVAYWAQAAASWPARVGDSWARAGPKSPGMNPLAASQPVMARVCSPPGPSSQPSSSCWSHWAGSGRAPLVWSGPFDQTTAKRIGSDGSAAAGSSVPGWGQSA